MTKQLLDIFYNFTFQVFIYFYKQNLYFFTLLMNTSQSFKIQKQKLTFNLNFLLKFNYFTVFHSTTFSTQTHPIRLSHIPYLKRQDQAKKFGIFNFFINLFIKCGNAFGHFGLRNTELVR